MTLKNLICGNFISYSNSNFISSKDNDEEHVMHSKR